jgi:hypothetical protein
VHFHHEELRVEVEKSLLDLLDHDYGGSLSRSAVIEKTLYKLQVEVRRQEVETVTQLAAAERNWTLALQEGMESGTSRLDAASASLLVLISGLNSSLKSANASHRQQHEELRASVLTATDSLTTSIQKQGDVVTDSVASLVTPPLSLLLSVH